MHRCHRACASPPMIEPTYPDGSRGRAILARAWCGTKCVQEYFDELESTRFVRTDLRP